MTWQGSQGNHMKAKNFREMSGKYQGHVREIRPFLMWSEKSQGILTNLQRISKIILSYILWSNIVYC